MEHKTSENATYLDLLSVLHFVLGPLVALFSCLFLLHVAVGFAVLLGHTGPNGPPRIFGWLFIVFPGIVVLSGWTLGSLMMAAGYNLRRRMSHTFCIVIAAVECALMPLGTVLGVFTLVMLTKPPVKDLFDAPVPPTAPAAE